MASFTFNVINPEVMTYLMELGKDSTAIEKIVFDAMQKKPQLPIQAKTGGDFSSDEDTMVTETPKTRKRKAEPSHDFTEESIPEFLDALIEDHVEIVPGNNTEFIDISTLRERFETVLADRFNITRGSKGIIARVLKPKVTNELLTTKLVTKGAEHAHVLNVTANPLTWTTFVGEGHNMNDYLIDDKVTFKNVFFNAKFNTEGPRVAPCKPRTKKNKKNPTEQSSEPSTDESDA
jgi:hypothetical protein